MRRLLAALAFAASVAGPGAAYAAAPVATGDMDVQLWAGAQPGQAVVIVGVELPETVKLPATVRIPVIKGMSVDWAGEILDSAASQDPQREYALQEGDRRAVRRVRGLAVAHGADRAVGAAARSSTGRLLRRRSTSSRPRPRRSPGSRCDCRREHARPRSRPRPTGAPETNEAGEALYTLPSAELAEGAVQPVALTYTTGPVAPAPQPAADSSALIALLLVLIVVAAGLLVFVLKRQGNGTRRRPDESLPRLRARRMPLTRREHRCYAPRVEGE